MSYDTGIRRVGFIGSGLINAVVNEVERAHEKHGTESMLYGSDDKSLRILVEEIGEVAREMNELALGNCTYSQYLSKQRSELIQVAAMALTWAAKIEKMAA